MGIDISCVLTLHSEGLIAHKTMRSINRTIACAEQHGVSTELLIVLDRANADTRRFVASSPLIDWAKTTL